jgi:hypothetical protein
VTFYKLFLSKIYKKVFASLGKGRRKQIYSTDSDEISRIVNRIAPQVNITSFMCFKTVRNVRTAYAVHLYKKRFALHNSLFQK